MQPLNDFLRHQQPTAATVRVLWYLNNFFQEKPWQGGFAHEQELRRCRLDYSLNSLQRIDALLDHVHTAHHPDADTFFNEMANQNFLSVIAFYCGEVLGRARRQAGVWRQYEDLIRQHPDMAETVPPAMWTDFLVEFPQSEAEENASVFFPLRAICSRLFGIEPIDSIAVTVRRQIPADRVPDADQALPEPPPQSLDFSIRHAVATTPAHDLPYLQMLPAPELSRSPLYLQIDALSTLYRQGRAVWAALVQADPDLLKANNFHAAAAEFIYDPSGRTDPDTLLQAAKNFNSLRNSHDDEEDADDGKTAYARPSVSTDSRLLHKVPSFISHMPLQAATVLVWRPHLPDGVLSRPLVPILINESTHAVTLLPARYWAHTECYQQWQNGEQPELQGETAPAFAALLADDAGFWRHYPELLRPLSEELPDLGHSAQPYTAEYTDGGKQRVRNYRTAAQSNYPRFSEDLPDPQDIAACEAELAAIDNTAYPPAVEKYARLRRADFNGILAELADADANNRTGGRPLPDAAAMLQRATPPSAYQISRFVHSLMKQSGSNHTAAVYLAYLYGTGKLLPQSLYEAAHWAHQAADGGDWRGTQLLAEMLIASPQAAPELMYERVSNEAYAFLPELKSAKLGAKEVEIQKKAYLNHPDAVTEIIRNLLAQASAQGHPVAPVRLQQLIERQRLPAIPPAEKYRNIRSWLLAHVSEPKSTESTATDSGTAAAEMMRAAAATHKAEKAAWWSSRLVFWMLLVLVILVLVCLFYAGLLPESELHRNLANLKNQLHPYWHGLQAFIRDLIY